MLKVPTTYQLNTPRAIAKFLRETIAQSNASEKRIEELEARDKKLAAYNAEVEKYNKAL